MNTIGCTPVSRFEAIFIHSMCNSKKFISCIKLYCKDNFQLNFHCSKILSFSVLQSVIILDFREFALWFDIPKCFKIAGRVHNGVFPKWNRNSLNSGSLVNH